MSPDRARAWIRVIRDAILIVAGSAIVGVVLLLYVVRDEEPSFTLLGVAGVFFGLGAALRADEWIIKNGNGKNGGKNGGA